jgi:hypothetical protein
MCRTVCVLTAAGLKTAQIAYNKKEVPDMGRFSQISH